MGQGNFWGGGDSYLGQRGGSKVLPYVKLHRVLTSRVAHVTHLIVPILHSRFNTFEKKKHQRVNLCPTLNKPQSGDNPTSTLWPRFLSQVLKHPVVSLSHLSRKPAQMSPPTLPDTRGD